MRLRVRPVTPTENAKARRVRYEAAHPERVKENRDRQNSRLVPYMLSRCKYRARKAGVPFDITVADITVPQSCPVLGIELTRGKGSGFHAASPSLDRIVPLRGYVRGNVRVISARANLLKNNATVSEIEAVLMDLRRIETCA